VVDVSAFAPKLGPGKIGVVTVTYNSAEVLPEFLDSLAAQTYRNYTVYVVDNASKDASVEICRRRADLPICLISNNENLGVAEGNNQGIRAALKDGCEYVLLLNNDTVFDGDLFAELHDGLVRYQCSMITPKILYHHDPKKIWAAGGYFQRWLGCRTQHYGADMPDCEKFDKVLTISYAPTCCVLIHRRVFDCIGLMDPLYFVYSDDADFMYRAGKAGIIMKYLPSARLLHKVSSLTGGLSPFTLRYCTRNKIYFTRKHFSIVPATFWILVYRSYLFIRYLMGRDTKDVWKWKCAAVAEGAKLGS
jgi:GT2 family glycosyltransferase